MIQMSKPKTRDCGTCSACCVWPEIPELKKRLCEPCSHLTNKGYGCNRHSLRPEACRSYQCAWSEGHGQRVDQPDHSAVLVTRRDSKYGEVLIAVDLGGSNHRAKRKAIKRIARSTGLICLLVETSNPDKILFAFTPVGTRRHPELEHLEVT